MIDTGKEMFFQHRKNWFFKKVAKKSVLFSISRKKNQKRRRQIFGNEFPWFAFGSKGQYFYFCRVIRNPAPIPNPRKRYNIILYPKVAFQKFSTARFTSGQKHRAIPNRITLNLSPLKPLKKANRSTTPKEKPFMKRTALRLCCKTQVG